MVAKACRQHGAVSGYRRSSMLLCLPLVRPQVMVMLMLLLLLPTTAGYWSGYCCWLLLVGCCQNHSRGGAWSACKDHNATPVIPRQLLHRLLQTESLKRSRNRGVYCRNGPTWGEVNGSLLLHEASCGLLWSACDNLGLWSFSRS